tara:strand:- start:510 stop:1274 length:765 start_codon:yes stop_codon:yes gene_type:complete
MINQQRSSATARAYSDPAAEILENFTPMVRKLAWHLHGSACSDIEPEDLMQVGLMALTECAKRHVGPQDASFAAYAKIRVKGAMIDQLRRSAPLSRGAMRHRRDIRNAEARLFGSLGRTPNNAELAAELDMTPAELEQIRATCEPIEFETIEERYSDADIAFRDQSEDAFGLLAEQQSREALIAAITNIPDRQKLVIQLYFVEELNLAEVAEVLGVSVPRVHQIKDKALGSLKAELNNAGISASFITDGEQNLL